MCASASTEHERHTLNLTATELNKHVNLFKLHGFEFYVRLTIYYYVITIIITSTLILILHH